MNRITIDKILSEIDKGGDYSAVDTAVLEQELRKLMNFMKVRDRYIVLKYFGPADDRLTLKRLGAIFGLSVTSIATFRNRSLRRMSHPARSEALFSLAARVEKVDVPELEFTRPEKPMFLLTRRALARAERLKQN
ncbi:hypothetical protein LUCX_186 [Xanthomonas phage vB_XciM_LucasX]|nr:hypothetical protein LUCX_186 [Xanthomonas phage vB_XciM_LucasX]